LFRAPLPSFKKRKKGRWTIGYLSNPIASPRIISPLRLICLKLSIFLQPYLHDRLATPNGARSKRLPPIFPDRSPAAALCPPPAGGFRAGLTDCFFLPVPVAIFRVKRVDRVPKLFRRYLELFGRDLFGQQDRHELR